jgi:DNA-binding response OmpR family regulator
MKKVLIVDDEPEILSILSFRISNWGYDSLPADSGQEGLDIAKEELPDLIILDVMMPILDGFETLKRLKQSDTTKNIPVIMITVANAKMEVEKGISMGANFYLTKPYDAQELKNKVIQLIGEGEK